MMSVQPSVHQILVLRSRRETSVVEVVHAAAAASRARATCAQSGSVGRLARTSIDDGVRWKT